MKKSWLKLDNSAKIYPMMMSNRNQNLFKVIVDLKEDVDKDILQQAADLTIPRFPALTMRLMRGFFWYYLEPNSARHIVTEESDLIFKKITLTNCNGYNFRINYYKKRLSIEMYHVICDGTGAYEFTKSLLHAYLTLKGEKIDTEGNVLLYTDEPQAEESEDAFNKYYKKLPIRELKINELKGKKAYIIRGKRFLSGKTALDLIVNTDNLLAVCRQRGCTATEFLAACYAESIKLSGQKSLSNSDTIQLFLPINLRKILPSKTVRNFTLFSRAACNLDDSFDDYVQSIHDALIRDTDKELLLNKISTTVRPEKLLIMRIVPLFVKQIVFSISNIFFGKAKKTATFSNVGRISMPKDMEKHIDNFHFYLGSNHKTPLNVAVNSFNDKMTISFLSSISDTAIPLCYAKLLMSYGLKVQVQSNMWEVKKND